MEESTVMRWDEHARTVREITLIIWLCAMTYAFTKHGRHPETPVCATPNTKDR